jgi:hypothetical protein
MRRRRPFSKGSSTRKLYPKADRARVQAVLRLREVSPLRKRMTAVAIALALPLAAFGAVTWWALESSGVAVLRTERVDQEARETHVWWVDADGALWIEAATPERGFLSELRRFPVAVLVRDGQEAPFHTDILATPDARARVRALMRAKYGWRDAWVGLLQDTSRSVAVRLTPPEPAVKIPPSSAETPFTGPPQGP